MVATMAVKMAAQKAVLWAMTTAASKETMMASPLVAQMAFLWGT